MTLLDFYDQVYRLHKHLGSSQGTILAYRGEIQRLDKFFQARLAVAGQPPRSLLVSELSDELLAAAMKSKLDDDESAAATANKLRRTINAVWNYARQRHLVEVRPELPRLSEPTRVPEAWTLAEMVTILTAAAAREGRAHRKGMVGRVPAGKWWPALIMTAVSTGVRISAVMQIETKHLNLVKGEVLVKAETQKQNADQRFELKPEVIELLRAICPERHRCVFDDWPFDRKKQQSWPALERHYGQILQAAGLTTSRRDKFHKLRKTFGTWIAAEAGEVVAQAMLGHSHISVTRRYLDPRQLRGPSARDLLPAIPLPASLTILRPPGSAA